MDKEIKEEFEKIWRKIKELETKTGSSSEKVLNSTPLKGIPGGIKNIIEEGFFDTPKEIKLIVSELNLKGYFAPRETIDCTVRRDFFKNKGILTRIKKEGVWKYVLKK